METSSPHPRPVHRYLLWGFLLAVLLAITIAVLMGSRWMRQGSATVEELPVIAEVPDFVLVNRDGRTVTRQDLAGEPWVADFVFTRCRVSCPVMTERLASLASPQAPLRRVSISVDPEHDRPEVLEEYARRHDAPPDWLFLTGSTEEIYRLIQGGFKLGVQPAEPGAAGSSLEPITHSTRFVLVDAQSRIRGYYDAFDPGSLNRLLLDLRRLR